MLRVSKESVPLNWGLKSFLSSFPSVWFELLGIAFVVLSPLLRTWFLLYIEFPQGIINLLSVLVSHALSVIREKEWLTSQIDWWQKNGNHKWGTAAYQVRNTSSRIIRCTEPVVYNPDGDQTWLSFVVCVRLAYTYMAAEKEDAYRYECIDLYY